MKIAAKFVRSGLDNLYMNEIITATINNGEEKLIDVEDEETGEQIRIFIK